MGIFDNKHFNSEVFGKYLETVPRIKQNAFLKAGIFNIRPELKTMLAENTGKPYDVICADTERDNWKTAEEAKEYGLIDKVITFRTESAE